MILVELLLRVQNNSQWVLQMHPNVKALGQQLVLGYQHYPTNAVKERKSITSCNHTTPRIYLMPLYHLLWLFGTE
jgi:hypothetical protein